MHSNLQTLGKQPLLSGDTLMKTFVLVLWQKFNQVTFIAFQVALEMVKPAIVSS
jgi:hypothetical protein